MTTSRDRKHVTCILKVLCVKPISEANSLNSWEVNDGPLCVCAVFVLVGVPCLLLHSATPGSFGSASVFIPLWLPSKGNSTVVVHFFPQDMSILVPSLPSHLLAYWVCSCHLQHFVVCHMLLLSGAEDSSDALGLEDAKLLLLFLCHLPRFTAVEKH